MRVNICSAQILLRCGGVIHRAARGDVDAQLDDLLTECF
jgi:hypothetical protein